MSMSPVRRLNERGDSSEMDLDEDDLQNEPSKDKLKCVICDFETLNHDIFRNHMVLHAAKDQDSPPPGVPSTPPMVNLPQYPLQIRSPLAINAEAKLNMLRRERPLSNESENEAPTSSSLRSRDEKAENSQRVVSAAQASAAASNLASMDYLEYLKKMAPLLKQSMGTPPMVSSTQTASSPPVVTGASTSELISRLYFGNMVKNLSTPESSQQKPPDADSSSGALDLSQLKSNNGDSNPPSRPQSGSQTSTAGSSGKSRRKGKAFKIERKLLTAATTSADADRDSLNSGHSEYSNEHDPEIEVNSDGSTASGKEPGTTTGPNGSTHLEEEALGPLSKNLNGSHVCKFCEIAFMDSIMFTIHMGYHGFQNPFKCNMCGEEMSDKVAFFLHIARKAHQ